ncbi:hypothetical protein ACA910_017325 [Epithemia clementina (nom. ined.)]
MVVPIFNVRLPPRRSFCRAAPNFWCLLSLPLLLLLLVAASQVESRNHHHHHHNSRRRLEDGEDLPPWDLIRSNSEQNAENSNNQSLHIRNQGVSEENNTHMADPVAEDDTKRSNYYDTANDDTNHKKQADNLEDYLLNAAEHDDMMLPSPKAKLADILEDYYLLQVNAHDDMMLPSPKQADNLDYQATYDTNHKKQADNLGDYYDSLNVHDDMMLPSPKAKQADILEDYYLLNAHDDMMLPSPKQADNLEDYESSLNAHDDMMLPSPKAKQANNLDYDYNAHDDFTGFISSNHDDTIDFNNNYVNAHDDMMLPSPKQADNLEDYESSLNAHDDMMLPSPKAKQANNLDYDYNAHDDFTGFISSNHDDTIDFNNNYNKNNKRADHFRGDETEHHQPDEYDQDRPQQQGSGGKSANSYYKNQDDNIDWESHRQQHSANNLLYQQDYNNHDDTIDLNYKTADTMRADDTQHHQPDGYDQETNQDTTNGISANFIDFSFGTPDFSIGTTTPGGGSSSSRGRGSSTGSSSSSAQGAAWEVTRLKDYMAIADVTHETLPLGIENGAPTFSFFVASNGHVGLGTSYPNAHLHLVGPTPSIRLEDQSTDDNNNYQRYAGQSWDIAANSGGFYIYEETRSRRSLPFSIAAGAPSVSLAVAENGNVGLGTDSPAAKLHVNGNARIDGTLQVGSACVLDTQTCQWKRPRRRRRTRQQQQQPPKRSLSSLRGQSSAPQDEASDTREEEEEDAYFRDLYDDDEVEEDSNVDPESLVKYMSFLEQQNQDIMEMMQAMESRLNQWEASSTHEKTLLQERVDELESQVALLQKQQQQ